MTKAIDNTKGGQYDVPMKSAKKLSKKERKKFRREWRKAMKAAGYL